MTIEDEIADVPMQLEIAKINTEGDGDFIKITVANKYEPVKDKDGNPVIKSETVQTDENGEPVLIDGETQTTVEYMYPEKIINMGFYNTTEDRLKTSTEIQTEAVDKARLLFGKAAIKEDLATGFTTNTVVYEQPTA